MSNTTKQVTITLTEEQVNIVKQLLTTRNVTLEAFIQSTFDNGLKQTTYRTERNRRVYRETKEALAMWRATGQQ